MPGVFGIRGFAWKPKRGSGEEFVVTASHAATSASPVVEVLQFDAEHGALKAFHAVVVADFVVIIAFGGAVFAQRLCAAGEGRVIGNERAAFSAGAEVLAGIEAKPRHDAESADDFAFVLGAVGLT